MNSQKIERLQSARAPRLGYLDWMRGLAVFIMLQGHVMDAWVRPQDRVGERFWLSQFLGGLPAPIFLFLVGLSLSLVIDKLRTRNAPALEIGKTILRRAGWILLLAYVFRLQQFLAWYPWSNWRDLLKVDTLNCIGVCMAVLGLASLPFRSRYANAAFCGVAAILIVVLTPIIYPLQTGLPWVVQSYFNGGGHPEYFSITPWIAFCFVGMTFGWLLQIARSRQQEDRFFLTVACVGALTYAAGTAMALFPQLTYGFFDYSLTSPYFFMARLGLVLLIFFISYRWSLRQSADGWSPLRTLGQASLVIYWIHTEVVYGRVFHDWSRSLEIGQTGLHLLWFIPGMIFVAWASRHWRGATQAFLTKTSETFQGLRAARVRYDSSG